jgi:hypothetical protein
MPFRPILHDCEFKRLLPSYDPSGQPDLITHVVVGKMYPNDQAAFEPALEDAEKRTPTSPTRCKSGKS